MISESLAFSTHLFIWASFMKCGEISAANAERTCYRCSKEKAERRGQPTYPLFVFFPPWLLSWCGTRECVHNARRARPERAEPEPRGVTSLSGFSFVVFRLYTPRGFIAEENEEKEETQRRRRRIRRGGGFVYFNCLAIEKFPPRLPPQEC